MMMGTQVEVELVNVSVKPPAVLNTVTFLVAIEVTTGVENTVCVGIWAHDMTIVAV